MNAPVTLYLADDHQIVIDGLKLLIGSEPAIRIIGYANDGETARKDIIDRKPDLALLDIRMPGIDGLELIYLLRKTVKNTKFIILTMEYSDRYIRDAISGGASGYLLKNAGKAELMKCLLTVVNGETYFPKLRSLKKEADKSLFTPRELEILKLVLDELTSAEIAAHLSLSPLTVETHRKNIGRKANTSTALGLSKFLREHKIEI